MHHPTTVQVYCNADGRSPVLDWLRKRSSEEQEECIALFRRLAAAGPGLRFPTANPLGDQLFELRGRVGRIQIRLIYFFHGQGIAVVAAGFIKQGPNDLRRSLPLALRRRADVQSDASRYTRVFDGSEFEAH